MILRYVPPSEVPLPSSLQESIDSVSFRQSSQNNGEKAGSSEIICSNHDQDDGISEAIFSKESFDYPLIVKETSKGNDDSKTIKSQSYKLLDRSLIVDGICQYLIQLHIFTYS